VTQRSWLPVSSILREPLLHFFVLGVVLFALYGWLNRHGFNAPTEIVVSAGQVDNLRSQFERVWQRAPSQQELQGLIDNWVREEVFYREGLAMGLDKDDPVVRRRIQQKVEFIVDSATPAEPTTEELQRWLDEHASSYRTEPMYELRQIYFDPARRGDRLDADIAAARRALASGKDFSGDRTMLPATLAGDSSTVIGTFGGAFEAALRDMPSGGWQGPVQSGFGWHLVEIVARQPARTPSLDEVREVVTRDLMHARVEEASARYYDRLRANYTVRIEARRTATPQPTG